MTFVLRTFPTRHHRRLLGRLFEQKHNFDCFPLPLSIRKMAFAVENSCMLQPAVFCSNRSRLSFFPCDVCLQGLFYKPKEEHSYDYSYVFIDRLWFMCCPKKDHSQCSEFCSCQEVRMHEHVHFVSNNTLSECFSTDVLHIQCIKISIAV